MTVFDPPAYLSSVFPGLKLGPGLLYKCPLGIRLELGGRGREPEVVSMVQYRAEVLYESVFGAEDECVVLYPLRPTPSGIEEIQFAALDLFPFNEKFGAGLNEPNVCDGDLFAKLDDEDEVARMQWVRQPARSFSYPLLLRGIANADYGVAPALWSTVFFLNPRTNVILHMYDDRGLQMPRLCEICFFATMIGFWTTIESGSTGLLNCLPVSLFCMRTSITIDDELMEEAVRISGAKTKREAVELGLRLLVRLKQQASIRELRGKLDWQEVP